ncbi:MAG TPA: STAS/SEC14 domain-containing protein [Bacteroidia bacterium]|nr:STAS/SEC14 domain-containing protein [Bacteroidia bacterium]
MKPPQNTPVFESPISTHWFDEDGILYSIAKNEERKIEHYQELMKLYQQLMKDGNKFYLLAEYNDRMPINKEVVDYLAEENPKYIKAMAVVTNENFGSGQINIFLKLNFNGFPVRKFSSIENARDWLKELMGNE